ncbi:hypothetical protein Droror1_Dr00009818 [Drosera rotundifolia]
MIVCSRNDWYEMHCESRLVALQALSVEVKGLMFLRREHLLDVTEIYRNLTREKKTGLKKLGVYLVYFFLAILSIPAGLFSLSAVVSSKRGELDKCDGVEASQAGC